MKPFSKLLSRYVLALVVACSYSVHHSAYASGGEGQINPDYDWPVPPNNECTAAEPDAHPLADIPSANSIETSLAWQQARFDLIPSYFINASSPPLLDHGSTTADHDMLDSRNDIQKLAIRTTARILSGCRDEQTEALIMHPSTAPFSVYGSDSKFPFCNRGDGNYDFALISFLYLYYVADRYDPNFQYFSENARTAIVTKFLNARGKIISTLNPCPKFPNEKGVIVVELEETENHVLMYEISRYLTNQILMKNPPEGTLVSDFDNEQLGNNDWMLKHLAGILTRHFVEYNSKTYQSHSLRALNLLYAFAEDSRVKLAAELLLDIVTAHSALQSSSGKISAPYSRGGAEPSFDSLERHEVDRLELLVGNFNSQASTPSYRSLFATIADYRPDPAILDLAIRENAGDTKYLLGSHRIPELYAGSKNVLISAGGAPSLMHWPQINLFPEFSNSVLNTVNNFINSSAMKRFIPNLINVLAESETMSGSSFQEELSSTNAKALGIATPTTIIPARETSRDIESVVRFMGTRDEDLSKRIEKTCVAPGFACGLQMELGSKVGDSSCVATGQQRSAVPELTFLDLSGDNPNCPSYGLYMAIYQKNCGSDACSKQADNYGFINVEESSAMSFDEFTQRIIDANDWTEGYSSEGMQSFVTAAGNHIQFVVTPAKGKSAIRAVNEMAIDRDIKNWPRARGNVLQSYTPGRVTIDSKTVNRRLILDVTNPLNPRKISASIPELNKIEVASSKKGRVFDDGASITDQARVTWIAMNEGKKDAIGLSLGWNNGLEAAHGQLGTSQRLNLQTDETITGLASCRDREGNITFVRIETSLSNTLSVSQGSCHTDETSIAAPEGYHIIGFHGRATTGQDRVSSTIHSLGVLVALD